MSGVFGHHRDVFARDRGPVDDAKVWWSLFVRDIQDGTSRQVRVTTGEGPGVLEVFAPTNAPTEESRPAMPDWRRRRHARECRSADETVQQCPHLRKQGLRCTCDAWHECRVQPGDPVLDEAGCASPHLGASAPPRRRATLARRSIP